MQNRYVGDLGDFGKLGLLRALCQDQPGERCLRLGIVWYLVPDDAGTNDGKHINYLRPTHQNLALFRNCDPHLYDALSKMVQGGERRIQSIRYRGILPADTVFVEDVLQSNNSSATRLEQGRAWLESALDVTRDCDIVFLDPDMGLQNSNLSRHKLGPKHVSFDELSRFVGRNQSVVVYQHLGRRTPAANQVHDRLQEIQWRLGLGSSPFALLYRRGTLRAFIVIPSQAHKTSLWVTASRFASGAWLRHCSLHPGGLSDSDGAAG